MLVIDTAQTRAAMPFAALNDAIRTMFIEGCEVPLRHTHAIDTDTDPATLLLMPAWQKGGRLGIKTVNIFAANATVGLPGLHSTYLLYDARTGVPLAQLDGNEITSRRTAAASALAATMLARSDARRLLVVGAGRVASLLPEAYGSVREITHIDVWDINTDLARDMVDRLKAQGKNAHLVDSLETAARAADIITCATLSTRPLILGAWLTPGVHLDLIGGFTPAMRESDDDCFHQTSVFMDTDEAFAKAGDLLSPAKAGIITRQSILGTLEDLCRQNHPGRQSPEEITVYKAVGTALEDLAAASLIYDHIVASRT